MRTHLHTPNRCCRQVCQSGAITLLMVIGLVSLASLVSLYSARSALLDRLASNHQIKATQSRLAAEAALAWARAQMHQQFSVDPALTVWSSWNNTVPCPSGFAGPRWQCAGLAVPAHPGLPHAVAQVIGVRDLVASPHVAQMFASASLDSGISRGRVVSSVFLPTVAPAPANPSTAALVLNGCSSPAAGAAVTLCPLNSTGTVCNGPPAGDAVQTWAVQDLDADGWVSSAERERCLGFLPSHLPAGGGMKLPTQSTVRSVCTPSAWASVLGEISPEQIRRWSEAQQNNGLDANSQPQRSIYWVDSPQTWIQSLGSPQAPVLLVFSAQSCAQRCPSLAPGVKIVGTVVLQSQCQDEKVRGWPAAHIEGQLVVESGLPDLQNGSRIVARRFNPSAYQLDWPAGMVAGQVLSIPGSWREGER
jgi:hypothetical protein